MKSLNHCNQAHNWRENYQKNYLKSLRPRYQRAIKNYREYLDYIVNPFDYVD